jgi:glutaconyl-CoA/methylmalonyl-CoA decarboxylase subunit gamma
MRYFVTFPSGEEMPVDVEQTPTGELSVVVLGRRVPAEVLAPMRASPDGDAPLALRVDQSVVDLWMEGSPPSVGIVARGLRFYAKVESDRMRALSAALGPRPGAGEGTVTSPMPGRVLKLLVSEGDVIKAGTPLVVVEAMKMENELVAARDGAVKKIFVTAGQTIEGGARLVEVG